MDKKYGILFIIWCFFLILLLLIFDFFYRGPNIMALSIGRFIILIYAFLSFLIFWVYLKINQKKPK